jgi:hypothetical protein
MPLEVQGGITLLCGAGAALDRSRVRRQLLLLLGAILAAAGVVVVLELVSAEATWREPSLAGGAAEDCLCEVTQCTGSGGGLRRDEGPGFIVQGQR